MINAATDGKHSSPDAHNNRPQQGTGTASRTRAAPRRLTVDSLYRLTSARAPAATRPPRRRRLLQPQPPDTPLSQVVRLRQCHGTCRHVAAPRHAKRSLPVAQHAIPAASCAPARLPAVVQKMLHKQHMYAASSFAKSWKMPTIQRGTALSQQSVAKAG
jgi:hypothetical protein